MPYNSVDQLPAQTDALPKHAKSIFLAAFNSSYGGDKDEKKAFQIAWGAVKNAGYIKKDGGWQKVSKASVDYWMHRLKGTESHLGQLLSQDERKKILRAARAHAGGKAKALKMKRMKEIEASLETDISKGDSTIGAILIACVHKYFTMTADDMAARGYIDTERRIAMSSAIGDALSYISTALYELDLYNVFVPADEVEELVEKSDPDPADVHVDAMMAGKKKKKMVNGMPEPMVAKAVRISKMDEEKKIIYGVALEPYTVDSQGDWETPEDIEETAHNFMKMYREMGIEHVTKNEKIFPVESYITKEWEIWELPDGTEELVKKGSWILGSKVEDPLAWNDVKAGLLTGYSVDGSGERFTDSKDMPDLWYMSGNIEKRNIPQSERDKMDSADFAGKGTSFPIKAQADVMAAFHSLGMAGADNYSSDQIRRNIIRIANKKGFSLPKSAQGDQKNN